MKILVTGGAGFIGSHIVDRLFSEYGNCEIYVVDDLSSGNIKNLNKKAIFFEKSIVDGEFLEKLFSDNIFDYVFHLAAVSNVQDSINNPVYTHSVNFDATLKILELSRKQNNLKRLFFASSAAVYGNKPQLPCSEDGHVNPISPYGVDKYASERYVINHFNLYGIPATAFRFFNIYGPRQNPSSPYSGVISIFANRFTTMENPEIKIFGDGKQTRDFVYVMDLVEAIIGAMKNDKTIGEVINIATSVETSLLDIVSSFEKITNKKAKIEFCPPRAGDIYRSYGNNFKLKNLCGITKFTTITEGLTELVKSLS